MEKPVKPVILAVDDDAEVLNAIGRDLRDHFGDEYRIVKASSGAEALQTALELKQRAVRVALFLVDERMPAMTGTQFLIEALQLYPDAKRVVLTAYADAQAAITGINRIRLDHYLEKPWQPPEEHLYPVLEALLQEWTEQARTTFDGIRVVGTALSPTCYATKNFLSANGIPYQWINIESDPSIRALVDRIEPGIPRLPVVIFPDGTTLVQPDMRTVAEKAGLHTRPDQTSYDLVIVGGGPAGLAAAVYGQSEGLRTLLVERYALGGQAGTSSRIENYLGFPEGVTGEALMHSAADQARRFHTEIVAQDAVAVARAEDPYRTVKLADGSELRCYAVVIATGMEVRRLEAPGIEELLGAGVYYGSALSEVTTYRNRDVVVVGGANSAGQGALFFAPYARTVSIVLRAPTLSRGMSQYLVDRINETGNVIVCPNTVVAAAHGRDRLESITLRDTVTGETRDMSAAAMFIFIGNAPHTGMVAGLVQRDAQGFILTGRDVMVDGRRPRGWTAARDPFLFETSVPGVFAAGDSRHGSSKRVAAAVGEGAATVSVIHEYLQTV